MFFFSCLPISEVKYLNFWFQLKLGHSTLMCPLIYSDENSSSYKTVFYVQDLIYKQHRQRGWRWTDLCFRRWTFFFFLLSIIWTGEMDGRRNASGLHTRSSPVLRQDDCSLSLNELRVPDFTWLNWFESRDPDLVLIGYRSVLHSLKQKLICWPNYFYK